MKLYEINSAYEEAVANLVVDEETGEVTGLEAVEQLQCERDSKIENTAKYIKNLTADADMYDAQIKILKAEIDNLTKQKKSVTSKIESLKNYLSWNLKDAGIDKFIGDCVKVTFRKSETLEVEDEDAFIETKANKKYINFKPSINKAMLKDLLKQGKKIKGVSIVEHQNIQIK